MTFPSVRKPFVYSCNADRGKMLVKGEQDVAVSLYNNNKRLGREMFEISVLRMRGPCVSRKKIRRNVSRVARCSYATGNAF